MTKVGLSHMVAALKDRCIKTMEAQLDQSGIAMAVSSGIILKNTLTSEQLLSLSAMISYVSHVTGLAEFRLERELSNHFQIPNPKCLSKDQYEAAMRFMVDRVPSHSC